MPHRASSPSPDHHGKAVRRRYGAWRLCSVSRWPSLESGQALNDVRSTPAVDTPRGTLPGECRRTNRHREALITHRRYFFSGNFSCQVANKNHPGDRCLPGRHCRTGRTSRPGVRSRRGDRELQASPSPPVLPASRLSQAAHPRHRAGWRPVDNPFPSMGAA